MPVPKGRQRRAEIAEYSEDDPDEDTFRDERVERRPAPAETAPTAPMIMRMRAKLWIRRMMFSPST